MKIRIFLKNGTVLPDILCDEFTVEKSNITGELVGYECKGAFTPRPVFVAIDQVEAIIRMS